MTRDAFEISDLPNTILDDLEIEIIEPIERTNLVTNPSIEFATTNYSAVSGAAVAQSTSNAYIGFASLAISGAQAAGSGAIYGATTGLSFTAGVTYAISCRFKVVEGQWFAIGVANTSNTVLTQFEFRGTGRWQWVQMIYTETSTTTRRLSFLVARRLPYSATLYLDAVQAEACETGNYWATTYIDGDQQPLTVHATPQFLWTGLPHQSTSIRRGTTRAGGHPRKLSSLGFTLTAVVGLDTPPQTNQALPFAYLDGAEYQTTRQPPRTFSLVGRVQGDTSLQTRRHFQQITQLLHADRTSLRQPVLLRFTPTMADDITLAAAYSGGLEGNRTSLFGDDVAITFEQFDHRTFGGVTVTAAVLYNVEGASKIFSINSRGQFSSLPNPYAANSGIGLSGVDVRAILIHPNGDVYVGGNFTNAGNAGIQYLARYTPSTGAWSAVKTTTSMTGIVYALALSSSSDILYIGGSFLNADGIAAADLIVKYTISTDTYAAMGSGIVGTAVYALAVNGLSENDDIWVGGDFINAGGSGAKYLAYYVGSWGGSSTAFNATVRALAISTDRQFIYIGGDFTNAYGFAAADYIFRYTLIGTDRSGGLGTGLNGAVYALATRPDGMVFIGGDFTTASGTTHRFATSWDGSKYVSLGTSLDDSAGVVAICVLTDSTVLFGARTWDNWTDNVRGAFGQWTGTSWIPAVTDNFTSGAVRALTQSADGTIYAGGTISGITARRYSQQLINTQSTRTPLHIRISGALGVIYWVKNFTTGGSVYFRALDLLSSEIIYLEFDGPYTRFWSTVRGDVSWLLLPGSATTEMYLQPGSNDIVISLGSLATISMAGPVRALGLRGGDQ